MIIINNILMRPIIALVASFLLESENIAAVFSDELDYGVYFDTRYSGLFPNGEQNPLGSGFYPNSPDKWSNVERDAFSFNWYAVMSDKFYKSNQCQDHDIKLCGSKCNDNYWYKVRSHKQSPIQVQYDPRVDACEDRHEFQTPVDGRCGDGDVTFMVTPTSLFADFKCDRQPILDWSRNPNQWIFKHMEIKVPAEHEHKLDNGQVLKYPGEIQLVHTGTADNAGDLGIIAIWLDAKLGNEPNEELERYITKWEAALEDAYADCNNLQYDESKCLVSERRVDCPNEKIAECCISSSRRLKLARNLSDENWYVITNDNFDGGQTSFTLETPDAAISQYGAKWYQSSSKSLRLRATTAVRHTAAHDVTGYEQLRVEFFFKLSGVGPNQTLTLEYSADDGQNWVHIKAWTYGENNLSNQIAYQEEVILSRPQIEFTTNSRLRFRVNGRNISNKWYLDDVVFSGSKAASPDNGQCTQQDISDCCQTQSSEKESEITADQPYSSLRGDTAWKEPSTIYYDRPNHSYNGAQGYYNYNGYSNYNNNNSWNDNNNNSWNQNNYWNQGSKRGHSKGRGSKGKKSKGWNGNGKQYKHPHRKLEFICNRKDGDFFCPYSLYEGTENPYYHGYYGSLTSPPCTESVRWRVMIDPLQISINQLHRIEMLIAKYVDTERCKLGTWGRPRGAGSCKVDVNRPIQYLSKRHKVEDCEKIHKGGDWSFEAAALDLSSIANATDVKAITSTQTNHTKAKNTGSKTNHTETGIAP